MPTSWNPKSLITSFTTVVEAVIYTHKHTCGRDPRKHPALAVFNRRSSFSVVLPEDFNTSTPGRGRRPTGVISRPVSLQHATVIRGIDLEQAIK